MTPTVSAAAIADLIGKPAPTPEQTAVIESPLEPSLVVAGAGSGKTETMAGRVVWLLANGLVAPEQVLGLTFTRKAAGELSERVRARLRHLVRSATARGVTLPGLPALVGPGDGRHLDASGLLGELARPTISTYNSYAAALVGDHALRIGVEPTSRLLGEAAQWQLASEVVESFTGDLGAVEAAPSTVVEAVLSLSGALDEHLLDVPTARRGIDDIVEAMRATPAGEPPRAPYAGVRDLLSSLEARAQVLELVGRYRDRKRAADSLDFGDQVALAARLARVVPEVAATERARFAVVLLDEYQDTSYAQLTLLSALFGQGHPVTAVGDPHQSIYGWRGASAGGLGRFPETFWRSDDDGGRRPAPVHQLSVSWRNDEAVLDAANHVAGPLRRAAHRVHVPRLTARPGAGPGAVGAVVAATVEEEGAAIAEFLHAHRRAGGVTSAVLCRKRAQFPVLRRALLDAGLPVEVVGLGGLLATPEVVDLVATLQAADDPSRGDALMRLLTGARTRLGAADLHALAAWSAELAVRAGAPRRGDRPAGLEADVVDERSIVDAIDELPPAGWTSPDGRALTDAARRRLGRLAGVLRTLRAQTYLSLPELVGQAERLLDLDIEVTSRPGRAPGRARAHLDAFRDVAVEFAESADHPTLAGFVAWLDAAETRERGLEMPVAEPDPDAVQLITVHAAKGLEWDVVAVAGLVDGGLPSIATTGKDGPKDQAWLKGLGELPYPLRGDRHDLPTFAYAGAADAKDLEDRRTGFLADAGLHAVAEERRLAYVAFTRARRALLLTAARWADGVRPRAVSPFLSELADAGLVAAEGWAPAPEAHDANPRDAGTEPVAWPADPLGEPGRRDVVEEAARAVRAAAGGPGGSAGGDAAGPGHDDDVPPGRWHERTRRLLAERAASRQQSRDVELPAHLSASALVRLRADPDAFASALRRPVPLEPSPQARRGTAFHAWVEAWFGAATLVDVDTLPGADDDSVPADADAESLREAFRASEWADRRPLEVEVDIETSVDGYVVRSRIDAVFADLDAPAEPPAAPAVVIVDWKTGAPPADDAARAARELQLAVYRLAWSRATGTPLERVRAAFCYVGAGTVAAPRARTVYPTDLLGEDEITQLLRDASDASDPAAAPAPAGARRRMPTSGG